MGEGTACYKAKAAWRDAATTANGSFGVGSCRLRGCAVFPSRRREGQRDLRTLFVSRSGVGNRTVAAHPRPLTQAGGEKVGPLPADNGDPRMPVHANLSAPSGSRLAVAFNAIGTVANGFDVFSGTLNGVASRHKQHRAAKCENGQKLFHCLSPTARANRPPFEFQHFRNGRSQRLFRCIGAALGEAFEMIASRGEGGEKGAATLFSQA